MFIAEIIVLFAESLFLVYLIRKQKNLTEKEYAVKRRIGFLDNLKIMLDEDYAKELKERKICILNEFEEKLYGYHTARKHICKFRS
ncbi:MAG: hypothetical protein ACYCSQ_10435 [bacterium]